MDRDVISDDGGAITWGRLAAAPSGPSPAT